MKPEIDLGDIEEEIKSFKVKVQEINTDPADKTFTTSIIQLTLNAKRFSPILQKDFSDFIVDTIKQVSFIKMYHSSYRMEFAKSLMKLCTTNVVKPIVGYEAMLPLVMCEDKELRAAVLMFITYDIKKRNNKSNPVELNKKSKTVLEKFIKEKVGNNANYATRIFAQLFMQNVWTDAITVNILAECCLHSSAKVKVTALKFFLNKCTKNEVHSEEESDTELSKKAKIQKLKLAHRVGKKSQARQKHLDRELNNIKKKSRRKKDKPDCLSMEVNVLALQQLRDPQMFAEKIFSSMKKAPIHIRMLMIELLSRLIGYHKLQLVNFYPYINGFLNFKTNDVTKLLVYAAQASHEYVSPDDIQPVVKMIADQFINEGVSGPGIALGMNSIREICARCPHAMPDDLLPLLIEFRTYRDKNVVSATRSLIRLFREINPNLLPKSERGRPSEAAVDAEVQGDTGKLASTFGGLNAVSFVPGAEIIKIDENSDEEEYESCSEISDDEDMEDWVDIVSSEGEGDEDEDKKLLDPEERRKLAEEASYNHIFTDAEHQAIKLNIIKKAEKAAKKSAVGKRKAENLVEVDSDTGEVIDPNVPSEFVTERSITKMSKKLKSTREEKIESIHDGRVDRAKYGFNVNKFNPKASTTNREKARKKNYMMVRPKKKVKQQKMSLKQKNRLLQKSLLKKAKFMRC